MCEAVVISQKAAVGRAAEGLALIRRDAVQVFVAIDKRNDAAMAEEQAAERLREKRRR